MYRIIDTSHTVSVQTLSNNNIKLLKDTVLKLAVVEPRSLILSDFPRLNKGSMEVV